MRLPGSKERRRRPANRTPSGYLELEHSRHDNKFELRKRFKVTAVATLLQSMSLLRGENLTIHQRE